MPKYNSIDNLPAKVFFEILKTRDYQLLKPKPNEVTEDLETLFRTIQDSYFLALNDPKSILYLRLYNSVHFLNYKIELIDKVLRVINAYDTVGIPKEEIEKLIDALAQGCKIRFDKSKPLTQEIERVLKVEIGILKNDLSITLSDVERMSNEGNKEEISYYKTFVSIQKVMEIALNEKMVLAEYLEWSISAKQKVEQLNKK